MENIQQDSVSCGKPVVLHGMHATMRATFLGTLFVVLSLALSACNSAINLLGGGAWQPSTFTTQHIRALAVDSTNEQELYAGDENGSIYVSSDGGLHWALRSQVSSSSLQIQELVMVPTGKSLFALTNAGLFVSMNQAQTWQSVSVTGSGLPTDGYTTMIFDEQKSIYLGTHSHGIYSSSVSDGAHWHSLTGNLPTNAVINELAFDSTQDQLWAATSRGVFRTQNNGQLWSSYDNGLPSGTITSLQLAVIFGGTTGLAYAGTTQGIYRSMDNGAHWSPSGQILDGVLIYHILIDFRSANAATVYAGTPFGIFRSDDNGQNWMGVAANFPKHTPVYALVIGGASASQLYVAANNIYLYPGTDSGLNPTRIVTLLLIVLLFFLLTFVAQRSVRRRTPLRKPQATEEAPSNKTS